MSVDTIGYAEKNEKATSVHAWPRSHRYSVVGAQICRSNTAQEAIYHYDSMTDTISTNQQIEPACELERLDEGIQHYTHENTNTYKDINAL